MDAQGKHDGVGPPIAYPDTLVGTDSHTTMVNGLGVLGWGVGGIEAEAAMLGQPISMLIPEVIGFRLTGKMKEGATATDLVLTVTEMLRKKGVVGKFVEFYGPGLGTLSLEDRATIANMAPEYGATCGYFPIDEETLRYLTDTARDKDHVALVAAYAKAQGLYHTKSVPDPLFTDTLELDLAKGAAFVRGPKRPAGPRASSETSEEFHRIAGNRPRKTTGSSARRVKVEGKNFDLGHGDVVIAAITSCTNTSNPSVLIGAGLLARNAAAKGLTAKPWVKTSLAPGSQVVMEYLKASGLQEDLEGLGFNLIGFGCTTCIGNSGRCDAISKVIGDMINVAKRRVLSGNRNFEGRVSPDVQANYLASPPLVVAYALAGTVRLDLSTRAARATDKNGQPVYLRDIWPIDVEIRLSSSQRHAEMFQSKYADVFKGDERWQAIDAGEERKPTAWNSQSTPRAEPALFRRHEERAGPDAGHYQCARARPVSATRSPPTTFRRPAPSSRHPLQANI